MMCLEMKLKNHLVSSSFLLPYNIMSQHGLPLPRQNLCRSLSECVYAYVCVCVWVCVCVCVMGLCTILSSAVGCFWLPSHCCCTTPQACLSAAHTHTHPRTPMHFSTSPPIVHMYNLLTLAHTYTQTHTQSHTQFSMHAAPPQSGVLWCCVAPASLSLSQTHTQIHTHTHSPMRRALPAVILAC